ncbi:MAG TPA: GH25 family lysozyme, partial [Myxococcaceae bacterium]|nr:GH25 family lysozyme [Myxococcaceae bacterium]
FSGDLPPVVDFETTDGITNNALIAQRLSDFLTTVQSQTGRTPMIYVSPSFWNNTVGGPSGFSQYLLWIANYGVGCPDVPGQWSNWAFWQFTASDTVTGISGAVDGDYFNGTLAGLVGLTDAGASQPPDAGSKPDAGTSADSGTPPDAGSVPPDAGSPPPDSGTLQADAGSPDSGTVAPDAGRAAPDAGSGSPDGGGTSTTGKGGCGCSGSGSNAAAFLAGMALVWARKRRTPFFLRPASG